MAGAGVVHGGESQPRTFSLLIVMTVPIAYQTPFVDAPTRKFTRIWGCRKQRRSGLLPRGLYAPPKARRADKKIEHVPSSRKRHDRRFWPILCYRISAEGLPARTALKYLPSETRFKGRSTGAPRTGLEADVWASGSAVFGIRAGCPLESFFGSDDDILLVQTVETIGRLPRSPVELF